MADNEMKKNESAESAVPAVKKADKPAKRADKKPNVFARIGKWIRDLRSEAKKVIWPTKKQVFNNSVVVIIMVVVVAIIVAALDTAFGFVRDFLAQLATLL